MERTTLAQLIDALAASASRRGVFATLSAGLLATSLFALNLDEAGARKKRHHKKKKQRGRKKRGNSQPVSPSPPLITAGTACDEISDGSSGGDENARLAQTFTALGSGALVRADLLLEKGPGIGDFVLRLSPVDGAGDPTNTVLAETAVANATVPVGRSLVSFAFAAPFSIIAGTQYALVLSRPGGDSFAWRFKGGDPCPGQCFLSLSQTGQFVIAQPGDFIFTTFISA